VLPLFMCVMNTGLLKKLYCNGGGGVGGGGRNHSLSNNLEMIRNKRLLIYLINTPTKAHIFI